MKMYLYRFSKFIILIFVGLSNAEECDGESACRISSICSNYSQWNIAVPVSASLLSEVCDVAINIDCIRASMKNNTKYSLILLLSTISDEISRIDADVLSANKTPIGAEILYSQDIFLIDSNASESDVYDLRNLFLYLPSDTCGQMFLIATLWSYLDGSNRSLVSTRTWPFQVLCETEVDLTLSVQLETFPSVKGIFKNNVTLVVGVPLSQQLTGLEIYLINGNDSKTFYHRSNPSLPQVMVYVTPQKHTLLTKGFVSYSSLKYRLGDVMLHTENLIDLQEDETSSEIIPGGILQLNSSVVLLRSTSVCGEALLVFRLELEDWNVENNFAVIPVYVDCWALPEFMGASLGACGVIPDEFSMGNSALMYTSVQPYGTVFINAFLYKAEEKTFMRVRGNELFATDRLKQYRNIQLERDRLFKMKQCPMHTELRLKFNTTLFGQLCTLIEHVNARWIPLNESEQLMIQQDKIRLIGQALAGLLVASSTYNSVPAYFVDSVLNGLFTYWPFFPYNFSPESYTLLDLRGNSTRQTWHDRVAKVVTYFMRSTLFADYDGQVNPDTGLQNFLNQLLWSSDSLESTILSRNTIAKLRQLLIMILEKQLPRTFDNLPPEIIKSLLIFSEEFMSPLPVKETLVQDLINLASSSIQDCMINGCNSSMTETINETTNAGDVTTKLKILASLLNAFNTSTNIRRIAAVIRKVQESISLNKQWIMMEGMSDTALDAELYCRLRALNRINFRLSPEAGNLFDKLSGITFWKTDSGVIYRGDVSGITGRLYWNRVAVCNCDEDSRTQYQSKTNMP